VDVEPADVSPVPQTVEVVAVPKAVAVPLYPGAIPCHATTVAVDTSRDPAEVRPVPHITAPVALVVTAVLVVPAYPGAIP